METVVLKKNLSFVALQALILHFNMAQIKEVKKNVKLQVYNYIQSILLECFLTFYQI